MIKMKILGLFTVVTMVAAAGVAADFRQTETSTFPTMRPVTHSDERMPNIGLLLGSTSPDGNYLSSPELGIDLNYQPYVPIGLGIEAAYSEPEHQTTGDKLKRTSVLAKAAYNFGGNFLILRDSYVGVGAGVVLEGSESDFVAAPLLGFDIPIRNAQDQASVSLGAEAKYLMVSGEAPDAVSVNGVVRYWY